MIHSEQKFIDKILELNTTHYINSEDYKIELKKLYAELNPVNIDGMTVQETRKFGSALNKHAEKVVKKNCIIINIDMLQIDENNKLIRLIESKHNNEGMVPGQKRALQILAKILSQQTEYEVDVCIVQSSNPFDTGEIIFVDYDPETKKPQDRIRQINSVGDVNLFLNMNDKRQLNRKH